MEQSLPVCIQIDFFGIYSNLNTPVYSKILAARNYSHTFSLFMIGPTIVLIGSQQYYNNISNVGNYCSKNV